MHEYSKTYEVKWADLDANRHMRHTAYNDYAAQTRVGMFSDFGLSISKIARLGFGPILFREETKFFKELNLLEEITVTCVLKSMRKNGSRWSFSHEIYKEGGVKAAEITVDGAWLDLDTRKLGEPTAELLKVMNCLPKADNFEWTAEKNTKKNH